MGPHTVADPAPCHSSRLGGPAPSVPPAAAGGLPLAPRRLPPGFPAKAGETYRPAAAVLMFVLILVLAGCGFQPRGSLVLPGSVEVRGGSFALRDALNARLAGSGARPAGMDSDADVVLDVRTASFGERVLTVEPLRGEGHEYRITYRVRYTVRDRSGQRILDPGEVNLSRDYRLHRGGRKGRGRERARIRSEMHGAAAEAILRRLHALAGG